MRLWAVVLHFLSLRPDHGATSKLCISLLSRKWYHSAELLCKEKREREGNKWNKKGCVFWEPLSPAPLTLHPNCYTGTLILARLHKNIKPRNDLRIRCVLCACLRCRYVCSCDKGCWLVELLLPWPAGGRWLSTSCLLCQPLLGHSISP